MINPILAKLSSERVLSPSEFDYLHSLLINDPIQMKTWEINEEESVEILTERLKIFQKIYGAFERKRKELDIGVDLLEELWNIYIPLSEWIVKKEDSKRTTDSEGFIVGLAGAPGTGKTTLLEFVKVIIEVNFDRKVAGFSLDDIYKTKSERIEISRKIHPLFKERGVPGTHDLKLGIDTLNALKQADDQTETWIPVFSKALDARLPKKEWIRHQGKADIVILEGWCVGATPQEEKEIEEPVNIREATEDPSGIWRRYANHQLKESYLSLFNLLDILVMIKAPSVEHALELRWAQETKRAQKIQAMKAQGMDTLGMRALTREEFDWFLMLYHRIVESMLQEMPKRADLVLEIDENREFLNITSRR